MDEDEINDAADAAFFMANEVMHEYHGFPVVQRADFLGGNFMFIKLGAEWYKMEFQKVTNEGMLNRLEDLAQ